MNEKKIVSKNLPFWQNIDDNEYVLKVSSTNCKCNDNVDFVEDVEYMIEVEFKHIILKNQMDIHVYYIILLAIIQSIPLVRNYLLFKHF